MARPTVAELVQLLGLAPHPEGGYFKETFRAAGCVDAAALPDGCALPGPAARDAALTRSVRAVGGPRSLSTAIFFLVPRGSVSRLHRIRSAEVWHFYLGEPLTVYELDAESGAERRTLLGADVLAGQRLQARRSRMRLRNASRARRRRSRASQPRAARGSRGRLVRKPPGGGRRRLRRRGARRPAARRLARLRAGRLHGGAWLRLRGL